MMVKPSMFHHPLYIVPASITLAPMPAKVLMSAPANVHLVFVTFAVRK